MNGIKNLKQDFIKTVCEVKNHVQNLLEKQVGVLHVNKVSHIGYSFILDNQLSHLLQRILNAPPISR